MLFTIVTNENVLHTSCNILYGSNFKSIPDITH